MIAAGHWPSVGVIIPTRNRPELLRRAVAGIVAQDYPGHVRTIVIFDQHDPDAGLCRGGERPLDVLPNLRKPGLAGARNTGIVALDTDLVAFCDDDDVWLPTKLRRQVHALQQRPQAEFCTSAIEVEFGDRLTPRLAGASLVGLDDLVRSRMSMLHSSTFLVRRSAFAADEMGLVAEDAPGSQNEDWDLLLRAVKRGEIVHVDEPLVRVLWGRTSMFAYEYGTKMASLRWMMGRHPEIAASTTGAGRVYGQLACWSAATGNRRDAWRWTKAAMRSNWREPRAAIALAAVTGVVRVESVLGALHRRGRGI
ncbi:glycosyltransferase family 2 protein [Dactylosporangium sp. NPDC051541]|uniref:glycosyltransferase family 2 protein n=1 Tax=Dactylosporangium sp. NPDC051541 TaxID=3363977 RepID=UPI0037A1523E